LLEARKNGSEIACIVGVNKSTISRELKRNIGLRGLHAGRYMPGLAVEKTSIRHSSKPKAIKLTRDLKDQAGAWLRRE
jgi:IS30 family transposase